MAKIEPGAETILPNPIKNFEAGLKELEKVVREMESPDLPLERSLELFEKGMDLSESCRKLLVEAETRVDIVMKKEGKYRAEAFRSAR